MWGYNVQYAIVATTLGSQAIEIIDQLMPFWMLLYGYLINSNQENDVFVVSKRDRFDWIFVTMIM